jgi:hypothetical protein
MVVVLGHLLAFGAAEPHPRTSREGFDVPAIAWGCQILVAIIALRARLL